MFAFETFHFNTDKIVKYIPQNVDYVQAQVVAETKNNEKGIRPNLEFQHYKTIF